MRSTALISTGLISRRQLLDLQLRQHDLERMLRRRELAVVHPGVYVEHTGPLTWQQRAWAGVLFAWPAALTHRSAVRAAEGPGRRSGDDRMIEVVVDRQRHLSGDADDVRIRRMRNFEGRVQWNLGPPRVRYDDAIIDVAADAPTDLDAVAALADAYVYRVLVNTLTDARNRRWNVELPTEALPDRPGEEGDATVGLGVRRALAAMRREHREVLVLRYYADLSERETADVLRIPAGTVKSCTSRALAVLAADQNVRSPYAH